MPKALARIPYTGPLPPPRIVPESANTLPGAVAALAKFLVGETRTPFHPDPSTVVLSGAGISVASGLADYRGRGGTYTLNRTYRPIYFSEYVSSHRARQRYWARSFLGWTTLNAARPNPAHKAIGALGELGIIKSIVTQSERAKSSVRLKQLILK